MTQKNKKLNTIFILINIHPLIYNQKLLISVLINAKKL